jgi:hypothetical protein
LDRTDVADYEHDYVQDEEFSGFAGGWVRG